MKTKTNHTISRRLSQLDAVCQRRFRNSLSGCILEFSGWLLLTAGFLILLLAMSGHAPSGVYPFRMAMRGEATFFAGLVAILCARPSVKRSSRRQTRNTAAL